MENNPIDTNGFTHFLHFKSLGQTFLYEISEPPGFDASNLFVGQEDERFGRDVMFGNDKINETYYDVGGLERGAREQVIHPNGQSSQYLDLGFQWIIETYRIFGSEGEIFRILKKDRITFTTGQLDMSEPDTDGFTYFGCAVIQNTNTANYKRHFSTTIDLFSTINVYGKPITPAPTLNFLSKATPLEQTSVFKSTDTPISASSWTHPSSTSHTVTKQSFGANNASVTELTEIEDTKTFAQPLYATIIRNDILGNPYPIPNDSAAFCVAELQNDLSDVTVNVSKLIANSNAVIQDFFSTNVLTASGYAKLLVVVGNDLEAEPFEAYTLWSRDFEKSIGFDNTQHPLSSILPTLTIPSISRGKKIYMYFACDSTATFNNTDEDLAGIFVNVILTSMNVKVSGSALSLDNVIGGVWYPDVLKQCSKFINGLPVDAPMFDEGGEFEHNICYGRSLVSANTSNSLVLVSDSLPEGESIGQVITNTNPDVLTLGLCYWNGTVWKSINSDNIPEVSLSDESTPAGSIIGDAIFNTNTDVTPNGLCYWNGDIWIALQTSVPFVTTFEDAFSKSMTVEACADFELQNDRIAIRKYDGFYENIEIASFLLNPKPSKDLKNPPNERFKINSFKIGNDEFETNRLSKNTTRDIHTEVEYNIPNEKSENKIERSNVYIRSAFSRKAMLDLETKTPQTADENDDKVYIEKLVALPFETLCIFSARLNNSIIDGNLHLANKASDVDTSNAPVNWNTRGLNTGQLFTIVTGSNAGNYNVVSWTNAYLILTPISFTPSFTGDESIKISYEYLNLFWQTKTNEGYTLINGIFASDRYPNLDYTNRKNAANWEQFLASACIPHKEKKIKKLYYRNNPSLITQQGGGPIYVETEDILVDNLPTPILSQFDYENVEVSAGFAEVLSLLRTLLTTRGFIRCYGISGRIIKGYIKELDYTWKTGKLLLKLEEKFEPQIVALIYADGILSVNDAPYNLNGNLDWWKITGSYFECFDDQDIALCNIRHYSNVKLNEIIYDSAYGLEDALRSL